MLLEYDHVALGWGRELAITVWQLSPSGLRCRSPAARPLAPGASPLPSSPLRESLRDSQRQTLPVEQSGRGEASKRGFCRHVYLGRQIWFICMPRLGEECGVAQMKILHQRARPQDHETFPRGIEPRQPPTRQGQTEGSCRRRHECRHSREVECFPWNAIRLGPWPIRGATAHVRLLATQAVRGSKGLAPVRALALGNLAVHDRRCFSAAAQRGPPLATEVLRALMLQNHEPPSPWKKS